MLSVYKGIYVINRGKIYNNYFVHVIKKLPFGFFFCKIYKKRIQYYKQSALRYLSKYVDVQVRNAQTNGGATTFYISNMKNLKYAKQTKLVRCMSKQDGSYVGCPENVLKLIHLGIDSFYRLSQDLDVSCIGFSNKYNRWFYIRGNQIYQLPYNGRYKLQKVKQNIINMGKKQSTPSLKQQVIKIQKQNLKHTTKYIENLINKRKQN